MEISPKIWQEIEREAKKCRKAWGMGFDLISIRLLKQIMTKPRQEVRWTPERSNEEICRNIKNLPKE